MLTIVWKCDFVDNGLPHEEGHVEGEGGQETDVEEHDDHQVPLPRHAGPHQVFLQLDMVRIINIKYSVEIVEIQFKFWCQQH